MWAHTDPERNGDMLHGRLSGAGGGAEAGGAEAGIAGGTETADASVGHRGYLHAEVVDPVWTRGKTTGTHRTVDQCRKMVYHILVPPIRSKDFFIGLEITKDKDAELDPAPFICLGRKMACGRQPLCTKRESTPVMYASKATSSGAPRGPRIDRHAEAGTRVEWVAYIGSDGDDRGGGRGDELRRLDGDGGLTNPLPSAKRRKARCSGCTAWHGLDGNARSVRGTVGSRRQTPAIGAVPRNVILLGETPVELPEYGYQPGLMEKMFFSEFAAAVASKMEDRGSVGESDAAGCRTRLSGGELGPRRLHPLACVNGYGRDEPELELELPFLELALSLDCDEKWRLRAQGAVQSFVFSKPAMCTGVTHRQLTRSLDAKVDLRRTRTRLAGDDFKTRKLEEGPSAEAKASQLRHVMMTAFSALSMCRPMTFCPSVHGVEWAFVCVTLDLKTASFSIMFYHRGVFDAIFSVPACLGMTGPIPAGSPFVGVHAKVALLVSYDEGSTAAKMALVVHEWDSNDLIYAGYLDIGWTIYTESGQDARWIIATHEENEPALYAFDFATTQDSLHFRALLTEVQYVIYRIRNLRRSTLPLLYLSAGLRSLSRVKSLHPYRLCRLAIKSLTLYPTKSPQPTFPFPDESFEREAAERQQSGGEAVDGRE
ncbi:hypothetical protein C8Q74DRAFT_1222107 [Fomes fomentarius]|nr:hypothetical protein C8Q74DRAFT_1222107 [Fomes fomentarius]